MTFQTIIRTDVDERGIPEGHDVEKAIETIFAECGQQSGQEKEATVSLQWSERHGMHYLATLTGLKTVPAAGKRDVMYV